jgi:hypothetical protein
MLWKENCNNFETALIFCYFFIKEKVSIKNIIGKLRGNQMKNLKI